jgi:hypothetical protein
MINTQSEPMSVILPFATRAALARAAESGGENSRVNLTLTDRIEVIRWQEVARQAGYDRMVIHDRSEGDPTEVGTFLSIYGSGEVWSRWAFARRGAEIHAWCAISLVDIGVFSTMSEALAAVLLDRWPEPRGLGTAGTIVAIRPDAGEALPADAMTRAAGFDRPLGSAA